MTTSISDNGISYGSTSAAHSLYSIGASVGSNAITVTLDPTTIAFRSTTLTTGTPTVVQNASQLSLTIASTDSFGLVTAAGSQRIAILAINNAGTMELAASALYGGVSLDETGVITTATAVTTSTGIKAAAVRTGVAYKVVGFVDATFTTAVGWGSLVTVQGQGGQALAAMSSLGYGQTWQNVTASRAVATTYYNTTGRPITVNAGPQSTVVTFPTITITQSGSSVSVAGAYQFSTSQAAYITAVVPPGAGYSVNMSAGTVSLAANTWFELR